MVLPETATPREHLQAAYEYLMAADERSQDPDTRRAVEVARHAVEFAVSLARRAETDRAGAGITGVMGAPRPVR